MIWFRISTSIIVILLGIFVLNFTIDIIEQTILTEDMADESFRQMFKLLSPGLYVLIIGMGAIIVFSLKEVDEEEVEEEKTEEVKEIKKVKRKQTYKEYVKERLDVERMLS